LPVRHKDSAFASALARHVSDEGCQLVVAGVEVGAGQRFTLEIAATERISGSVRWVVGARAGFAFDEPIGGDTLNAIRQGGPGLAALDIYLIEDAVPDATRP